VSEHCKADNHHFINYTSKQLTPTLQPYMHSQSHLNAMSHSYQTNDIILTFNSKLSTYYMQWTQMAPPCDYSG